MTESTTVRPRRPGWGVAWVVLTGFVALAIWQFGATLSSMAGVLAGAHPGWVAAGVLLTFLGQPLQAMAWRHFVPAGVPYRPRAFVQTAGAMAAVSNSVPMFMSGLASGVQMLATRGGLGHATALAVVSLDQLSEGVAKVVLVGVVLAWAPLPTGFASAAGLLVAGVVVLAVVLGVAAVRGGGRPLADEGGDDRGDDRGGDGDGDRGSDGDGEGGDAATGGKGPPGVRVPRSRRLAAFAGDWAGALERLRSPANMAAGQLLVLGIKAGEAVAIYAVVRAVGADVPLWGVPLALLAVNLSTMVGVTPANLGVFEGAAFGAWTLAGAPAPTALALAVLHHAVFLAATVGGGWLLATAAAGSGRYLSRNAYTAEDRTFHLRDVLVVDEDPGRLGLGEGPDGEPPHAAVTEAVRGRLEGTVAPSRLVVLRRRPRVLVLILEYQPGVHPPGDLTLEEVVARFGSTLGILPRGLSLPVTRKREGERVEPYPMGREGRDGGSDLHPPRRVVFHFSRIEVGLGDRLVGLASTLVLARALGAEVVLDRPFLPDVFEDHPTGGDPPPEGYDLDFLDTRFRYHERLRTSDFSDLGQEVHVIGNECFHYGLYENPHVRHRLGDFDTDLRDAYKEIFRSILRPRAHVTEAVGRTLVGRGDPADVEADGRSPAHGPEWVGLQLRTGHLEREFPFHSPGDVVRYCRALADTLPGPPGRYRVFVTADDTAMAALARDTLHGLGLATHAIDAPVLHVSYGTHQDSESARAKLVTDILALAATDRLFFSFHSNFGRLAYMLGEHREAYGLYGRNFDLLPVRDAYLASSKHLVYNDAVGAALGGLLRMRYYGERSRWGVASLVVQALPGFARGMAGVALRRGWVPLREGLRIFMDSLHGVEGGAEVE